MFRFLFKVTPALLESKDDTASYILPVLCARIFTSPREFIYVIRYTCTPIHTVFCKQAGHVLPTLQTGPTAMEMQSQSAE